MSFRVNFVGLVYFHHDEGGKRLVLLPDGTDPYPGIDRHFASFFVETSRLRRESIDWWPIAPNAELKSICITQLPIPEPSRITIGAADDRRRTMGSGCWPFRPRTTLQTAQHDTNVKSIDPGIFRVDPARAKSIVEMTISGGQLAAFGFGRANQVSVTSQWTVTEHSGPVKVTAEAGGKIRSFVVEDWTELVLGNTARIGSGGGYGEEDGSHFKLYGKLDVEERYENLKEPPVPPLDPLPHGHAYLRFILERAGHVPSPGCSNIRAAHRQGNR